MVVLSLLLELVGEIVTDHVALHAEAAHGVPVERYFELLSRPGLGAQQLFSLVTATGFVLWAFSRIPSAGFCGNTDPCSCLDLATSDSEHSTNYGFEIYRATCACEAAITENVTFPGALLLDHAINKTCANFTAAVSQPTPRQAPRNLRSYQSNIELCLRYDLLFLDTHKLTNS